MTACLRCAGVALVDTGLPDTLGCPACRRLYRPEPDGLLVERWPGPLGIVLYSVLFTATPQERAVDVAAGLDEERMDVIASEIELELREPRQPVRRILPDLPGSEADLRDYLRLVAEAIRVRQGR